MNHKPDDPKPFTPLSESDDIKFPNEKGTSSHFLKIICAIRFPFSTKKSLEEKLNSNT